MNSSSGGGKKDENRRNFTDFKIVGLEIQDLSWTWGVIPASKVESLTEVPSVGSEDTGDQQITVESPDPSNLSINLQDHSDTAVVKGEGASDLKTKQLLLKLTHYSQRSTPHPKCLHHL